MLILGLHDGKGTGVALLDDGQVVFTANEERYSGRELHFGFPCIAHHPAPPQNALLLPRQNRVATRDQQHKRQQIRGAHRRHSRRCHFRASPRRCGRAFQQVVSRAREGSDQQ